MYVKLFSRESRSILGCYVNSQYLGRRSIIEQSLEAIKESRCQLHRLDQCPNITGKLGREEALLFYDQMNLIRRMETSNGLLYQNAYITGFCHLYSGQEACAVGVKAVMRPQDTVITSYRCHGWVLLMSGGEEALINIFKELVGKKAGLCGGKSGSMHLYTRNFYGGNGVVGAQVSLGTGLALAHKYKNDGGICFSVIGDGAMNSGQVLESFNLARLYHLPVIYLIENNNYAMGTSVKRSSANTDLYKKGDLIPGIRISGMDVTTVRDTTKFAVQHILHGKGPIIVELLTYRYSGHSVADPGTSYRTREDVKRIREKYDPIDFIRKRILSEQLANKDELKAIDKKNKGLVDRAVEVTLKDADPSLSDLVTNVCTHYDGEIRVPTSFRKYLK